MGSGKGSSKRVNNAKTKVSINDFITHKIDINFLHGNWSNFINRDQLEDFSYEEYYNVSDKHFTPEQKANYILTEILHDVLSNQQFSKEVGDYKDYYIDYRLVSETDGTAIISLMKSKTDMDITMSMFPSLPDFGMPMSDSFIDRRNPYHYIETLLRGLI